MEMTKIKEEIVGNVRINLIRVSKGKYVVSTTIHYKNLKNWFVSREMNLSEALDKFDWEVSVETDLQKEGGEKS